MRNKKAKLIRRESRAEIRKLYRLKPWYCPLWVWHRITGRIGEQPFIKLSNEGGRGIVKLTRVLSSNVLKAGRKWV